MKNYSLKFWIIFWTISAVFLTGWFLFWNVENRGISATAESVAKILPIEESLERRYLALTKIGDFVFKNDNKEKTFLVLFQNNMEIRPGGGFIGAFGIVKIKNGKVVSMENHDLSNFDKGVPNVLTPPYPIEEILNLQFWKMRDSNFSPDFAINAQKTEEFYHLGGGREQFDGVIGITSDVLTSMLKVTGPIEIEGYPGTYDSENAILALEYQVEKAFQEQGIERHERKAIMSDLAREIEERIFTLSLSQKMKLAEILIEDLEQKDIQMNFKNAVLQKAAEDADWAGRVDGEWDNDFLMAVDANLGAFKSDYYVKRSMDYAVDFSSGKGMATLKISYNHTAKQKDWMTRNYLTYLRVYVPEGSLLTAQENFDDTKFGNEFGREYFSAIVRVPIDSAKTVTLNYELPENITPESYDLLIQKQAGIKNIPFNFSLVSEDKEHVFSEEIIKDWKFGESDRN